VARVITICVSGAAVPYCVPSQAKVIQISHNFLETLRRAAFFGLQLIIRVTRKVVFHVRVMWRSLVDMDAVAVPIG